MSEPEGWPNAASGGQIGRALAVLEAVAEQGSATARTVADRTSIPLPTVYRLAHELMRSGYLVHLRDEKRFALGYQLHRLAVRLHEDLGVPRSVREEIRSLHEDLGMAAYLAIHRGTDFVVVAVADSPAAPRLAPLGFGYRETPHATAFGKVGLSALPAAELEAYLDAGPLDARTPRTLTDLGVLRAQLAAIRTEQVAWEHEEFQEGFRCVAAPVTAGDGSLLGSVAVSAPVAAYAGRVRHVEERVRTAGARAGRLYRRGAQHE